METSATSIRPIISSTPSGAPLHPHLFGRHCHHCEFVLRVNRQGGNSNVGFFKNSVDSKPTWWLSFNPFEKYARQFGSFPQGNEGEKTKYLKPPPRNYLPNYIISPTQISPENPGKCPLLFTTIWGPCFRSCFSVPII